MKRPCRCTEMALVTVAIITITAIDIGWRLTVVPLVRVVRRIRPRW